MPVIRPVIDEHTLISKRPFALLVLNAWAISVAFFSVPYAWAETPGNMDWPQWRGIHRDGIIPNSPKLLDAWPKDGPPEVWKSEWVPGCEEGGCGSPVVVDGKVFVYVNAKYPVNGGKTYRIITDEILLDGGWLPDLPEPLAQKIEAAWASPKRPSSKGWAWWDVDLPKDPKENDLAAFLAKNPELDAYIKDFIGTLSPDETKKYASFIRHRLCMELYRDGKVPYGFSQALTWEQLKKLSTLRAMERPYTRECIQEVMKVVPMDSGFPHRSLIVNAWLRSFRMTDTMLCLEGASGKVLWKAEFPVAPSAYWDKFWDFSTGHYAIIGVSSTPTIADGRCYFVGQNGLYCLSASDGKVLWQVKALPEHAAPLVANGIVYLCGVAFDAATGNVKWKQQDWKEVRNWSYMRWSSPLLWTNGGKSYIITTDGNAQHCCVDIETGKVLWSIKIQKALKDPFSGLNRVLLMGDTFAADNQLYKITPAGAEPFAKLAPGLAVLCQGYLYSTVDGGDGQLCSLHCIDAKSGESTWSGPMPLGDGALVAPILVNGKLVVTLGSCHRSLGGLKPHRNGWVGDWSIQLVKPTSSEKYVEISRFHPEFMCPFTAPAISNGMMYLRLDNAIACYDLRAR